ncbi:murein hydrolase activator EnvC family protein [Bacillus shivajii]|uniref:murein hydrolase activator EnvC family protein n=1 Tax=Bacillus shivajii TaxID=1983719 RepID=UPI00299E287B|nr:peptidoglycan DD-metalloendopeptidase family protein [Bacillus shivajii]
MNRRLFIVSLALLVAFSTLLGTNQLLSVEANTGQDLEDKIDNYQQQQSDKEREARETEEELQKVEEEIQEVNAEIRQLDEDTARTNANIRDKQAEIDATNERIEDLRERIIELQERIAERDELLKDRVRSMYQNGGSINYIEVILGAQSFGDLIERVSALNMIAQQDQNILEQHVADMEELEKAKQLLEDELASLEAQMAELESLREKLEQQRDEKERLMNTLEQKESSLADKIIGLEEEQEILAAQEAAAKQELAEWEEEQRRIEEERKRQEEERKRQEQNNNQNNNSTNDNSVNSTPNNSGTLMRPATGRITSGYGPRWGRVHHGIDIGLGGRSNVEVVAAEAGIVVRSYYSASYGNTVLIRHNVNGQTITTLYAHLENRAVSDGERVSRGQFLGYMGNTGRSTGPHLHFEVHEGNWNAAKSNSVNPMNYIN